MSDTPDVKETLKIIAEERPAPSQANDWIVVAASALAGIGGLVFGVGLVTGLPLSVYGGALAVGLLALGLAVRRFFVDRFPDVEAIEERVVAGGEQGAEPVAAIGPVPRRRFLGRALAAGAALLGIGLVTPVVSLGPAPGEALRRTAWQAGRRLVTSAGDPVRPGDLVEGGILTVWPEGDIGDEFSAALALRLAGGTPQPPTNPAWVVDEAVVAYSKVCTHAGCPVALFRERDDALFCPCHQSTFDARRGAIPTFGPTARALPQLPLGTDDDGFLVALGDFTEQVGPAFG